MESRLPRATEECPNGRHKAKQRNKTNNGAREKEKDRKNERKKESENERRRKKKDNKKKKDQKLHLARHDTQEIQPIWPLNRVTRWLSHSLVSFVLLLIWLCLFVWKLSLRANWKPKCCCLLDQMPIGPNRKMKCNYNKKKVQINYKLHYLCLRFYSIRSLWPHMRIIKRNTHTKCGVKKETICVFRIQTDAIFLILRQFNGNACPTRTTQWNSFRIACRLLECSQCSRE